MESESYDIFTRYEASWLKIEKGKIFSKKQSRYKHAAIWCRKMSNMTDPAENTSNKGMSKLVLDEESVHVETKMPLVKPMTNINFAI